MLDIWLGFEYASLILEISSLTRRSLWDQTQFLTVIYE